jgi:integrase
MATIEDLWAAADGSRRPRHGTGRRYRVRWVLPGGVERSKSFPDGRKTQAKDFKSNIEADLLRGEYRDPRAGKITLREYVTRDWLPHQTFSASSREVTERRLRLHILPVLGDTMITHITPTMVKSWLGRLDGSPSTARQMLGLLSSILGAAIDDGLIVNNPCRARSVKAPKLERRKITPWTAERVAEVRAGLPPQWQAMADCGAGLGLRIGEACGLAAEDIDWLRRVVHIRRQVQRIGGRAVLARPKGGKDRDVPLPDSVAVALSEHIRQHPPGAVTMPWQIPAGKPVTAGLLFTMPGGKAIGPNDWNTAWHRALRAAGRRPARDAGFHQLRHHYASTLLAGGVDVRTLADALGHHDPGFTLRTYTHLMPDSADRIRTAIDRAAARDGTGTAPAQTAEKPS